MSCSDSSPRFLFVVGVSRSGTTLLKRLLNSYPQVLLWGEHHTFIRPLADTFYSVWDSENIHQDPRPWQERLRIDERESPSQGWINPFDRVEWECRFRTLIRDILVPTGAAGYRFVGFKDPGYAARPNDRGIELLNQLYPDAIFAFIIRDGFNQVSSTREVERAGRRFPLLVDGRRICDRWILQNRRLRDWHRSGALNSFWIRYEDLLRAEGDVHALFDHMGLSWGPDQSGLIERDPGWISSYAARERTDDYNTRWRTMPPTWRWYTHSRLSRAVREFGYEPPELSIHYRMLGRLLNIMSNRMPRPLLRRLKRMSQPVRHPQPDDPRNPSR